MDRQPERDDPKWVADRLVSLDQLYEDATARVKQVGFGAACQVVADPDTKGAVSASQHAAELRGLLGAGAKAGKVPPGANVSRGGEPARVLPDDPRERLAMLEAAAAELRAELELH